MKKISILMATLVAVLSLGSCKQNTEPRIQEAKDFKLNTPALASQYYQLTEEGTVDLDWSQPDWGFAAVADYQVQISLEETFVNGNEEEGTKDNYYTCPTIYNACNASISAEEIAIGICKLRGITDEESYTDEPARPIYVRVVGVVPQYPSSEIISNVICLQKVKGYCAIQSPGKIYLVGAPEGWKGPDASAADHYKDWALYESADAIGSKIYHGVFEIPAGSAMFRFYTALTGWDADSWGSQEEDNPIDFAFTGDEFNSTLVKGKGAFNFPDWAGGKMDITVDLRDKDKNKGNIIIKAVE